MSALGQSSQTLECPLCRRLLPAGVAYGERSNQPETDSQRHWPDQPLWPRCKSPQYGPQRPVDFSQGRLYSALKQRR